MELAGELLLGVDPTRVEYLWGELFGSGRRLGHSRQFVPAIAILDLDLCDLNGKLRTIVSRTEL